MCGTGIVSPHKKKLMYKTVFRASAFRPALWKNIAPWKTVRREPTASSRGNAVYSIPRDWRLATTGAQDLLMDIRKPRELRPFGNCGTLSRRMHLKNQPNRPGMPPTPIRLIAQSGRAGGGGRAVQLPWVMRWNCGLLKIRANWDRGTCAATNRRRGSGAKIVYEAADRFL